MLALLGTFAIAAAQPPETLGACSGRLCNPQAIAPFLARLRAPDSERPLHILQIGDSHTAGDLITGAWRTRLQARHGNGGRGVLAAGRPYQGYLTWGVTARQSAGWRVNATFGSSYAPGGAPLGLSGFTQTARAAGESLGLSADSPDQYFDRLVLCTINQPGAGTIAVRIGASRARWSLDAPVRTPVCRSLGADAPAGEASVETADGRPVSIASLAVLRGDGGAIVSNLGVTGAQLAHVGRTDDELVRAELDTYRPDLIVLAFGTNEGFSPTLTADSYESGLRAQVARLRRLGAADVPILLLGAPDAAGQLAGGDDRACGDGWSLPSLLGHVRRRQATVAGELGLGFWDWERAMGGACASLLWQRAGDMRPDRVHFTRTGAVRIAAMLQHDLLAAAEMLAARPAIVGERGF
jgi:lysophospholipase L1-like esterase